MIRAIGAGCPFANGNRRVVAAEHFIGKSESCTEHLDNENKADET